MDSEPLTKLQRKCLVSLWNVLPYSRDNEPHAAEDINRINSTCNHWESRAEAAEAEVERLKGYLDKLDGVCIDLAAERRLKDAAVAALRLLWTDTYHTVRKSESIADARERSIGEMLIDTGLDRATFDELGIGDTP